MLWHVQSASSLTTTRSTKQENTKQDFGVEIVFLPAVLGRFPRAVGLRGGGKEAPTMPAPAGASAGIRGSALGNTPALSSVSPSNAYPLREGRRAGVKRTTERAQELVTSVCHEAVSNGVSLRPGALKFGTEKSKDCFGKEQPAEDGLELASGFPSLILFPGLRN